jgi:hypothetical protein
MSLDLFIVCFRKGEPAPYDREIFDRIFLSHFDRPEERKRDRGYVQVTFPDGSRSDIGISYDGPNINCVSFNHFGGNALCDAMYDLADRSSSIIIWPSPESFTAVTNEAVVKDLPKEFSSDLSLVKLVHSGAEIEAVIDSSFLSSEPLASFCLDRLRR